MKPEMTKSRKQKPPAGGKGKALCGTLSYLAECRGTAQKNLFARREAPPEIIDRIVRKHPAV
jgi:hypothetical protein